MKKKLTMMSVLAALVVAAGAFTVFAASPKQEPVPGLSQEPATAAEAEESEPVAGQSEQEVEQFMVGYWAEPHHQCYFAVEWAAAVLKHLHLSFWWYGC